jgi:hypothetical protein
VLGHLREEGREGVEGGLLPGLLRDLVEVLDEEVFVGWGLGSKRVGAM